MTSDGASITSTAQLKREFIKRAKLAELNVRVPGDGAFYSEVAIVGEAVGSRELNLGMTFAGGSGEVLWKSLRKIGLRRSLVYATNVVKYHLPGSTSPDRSMKINPAELEHWQALLEWELNQLPNLKYVFVLGAFALKALLGVDGIMNWRGSVIEKKMGGRDIKFVCAYNPAHVLREPRWEIVFAFDTAKLKRVLDGSFQHYDIDAIINPSPTEALQWIERMHDEKLPVAFDIENLSGETACIGLANNNHQGMCINFRTAKENRYSREDEKAIRLSLQALLGSNDVRLIAQSGSFDSYWLYLKDKIRVHRVWFDTLLAHHTLYPPLPHNLGFMTTQYTDHPFYKDERKEWREGGDINEYWVYNVKDCCITRKVQERQLVELKAQKLDKFFFNHVMRLQPHLVNMTNIGVLVDTAYKNKLAEGDPLDPNDKGLIGDLQQSYNRFQELVRDATGIDQEINPLSRKDLQRLFFHQLKLVGRGISTNKENRARMRAHPRTTSKARLVLDGVDEYKKEHKFFSTYVNTKTDDDNRMRGDWRQWGVQEAPGRLSCVKLIWGAGTNFQNQPRRAYPMYIADPGFMFTYFDLKQAEAKCVAWLAPVPALQENFKLADEEPDKYDVHRLNAARIFNLPYDEIPKADWTEDGHPTIRYLGKRCVHGLNYRMMADKLATVCKIPYIQARRAYDAYHRAFPEIRAWWDETIAEVKKNKMLYSPLGRRWILLERLTPEALDSIIAFRPQSAIGDKVGSVIYEAQEDKEWPKGEAQILINVHDALVCMHRPHVQAEVQGIMKKYAEAPIIIKGEPVVIGTDFKHSVPDEHGVHRWSTLEEV